MKVLGISGSPRKKGNSEILIEQALKGASENGADTDLLRIYRMKISPCGISKECYQSCHFPPMPTGQCSVDDDMQIVYDKLSSADGIIFGVPVYMYSAPGQLKILLERTIVFMPHLMNKVAGVIVVEARWGAIPTISQFVLHFIKCRMLVADPVTGLANEKGEIEKDVYAMNCAYEQGKQVVALINKKFEFPEEYRQDISILVPQKYGTLPVLSAKATNSNTAK